MTEPVFDEHSYASLCENCEAHCCTDSISPFVFPSEVSRIKKLKHKPVSEFADEICVNNKTFHVLKNKDDSTECVFFDSKTHFCTIYEDRPFDCRLFPFDIAKIDGKYMWILFTCKGQTNSDWKWTEKNLIDFEADKRFQNLMENINSFSENLQIHSYSSNNALLNTSFVILREVRMLN